MRESDSKRRGQRWSRRFALLALTIVMLLLSLSAAAAAEPTSGSIEGRVTDSSNGGNAVANLEVCAEGGSEEAHQHCAKTGEDGRYAITGLPPGEYDVSFMPGETVNLVPQFWENSSTFWEAQNVEVSEGRATSGIDAVLHEGGRISGDVSDRTSKAAVGGVRACAWEPEEELSERCTISHEDGSYTIVGLATGAYDLAFRKEDGEPSYVTDFYKDVRDSNEAQLVHVTEGSESAHVDAAMEPAASISGTVTGGSGHEALAGISVCARGTEGVAYRCELTQADGSYLISGLPAGEYTVEFNPLFAIPSDRYLPQFFEDASYIQEATAVKLEAGTSRNGVDANLATSAQIEGHVYDSETGKPVAGIETCAFPTVGIEPPHCATTASDGSYAVEDLNGGSYRVAFSSTKGEYTTQYYDDTTNYSEAKPVEVAQGTTVEGIDAHLQPNGSISGSVTAASSGEPVEYASICVRPAAGNYGLVECGSSNARGEYTLPGISPGKYEVEFGDNYGNSAGKTDFARQFYNGASSEAAATTVEVTSRTITEGIDAALDEGGYMTGTVIDSVTGKPVQGIWVCPYLYEGYSYATYCATTDEHGSYRVAGLLGEYRVSFTSSNGSYATQYYSATTNWSQATPVLVAVGATSEHVDAAMDALGVVSGRVTNAVSKAGLAGVQVCALQEGTGTAVGCTTSEAGGTYELRGIPAGHYHIRFQSSDGSYTTQYYPGAGALSEAGAVNVPDGEPATEIDADMHPTARIGGTVTGGEPAAPLADVTVCAEVATTHSTVLCGSTAADGTYLLAPLIAGEYTVQFLPETLDRLDQAGYLPQFYSGAEEPGNATRIKLGEGEHVEHVDALLESGGTIEGAITDASSNAAVAGAYVCPLTSAGEYAGECGQTSQNGHYALRALSAGSYLIQVVPPYELGDATEYYEDSPTREGAKPIAVEDGKITANVDIAVKALPRLEGTVRQAGGGTLEGIQVCAYESQGYYAYACAYTDASGHYALAHLQPGDYRVAFFSPQGAYVTQYYNGKASYNEATAISAELGTVAEHIDAELIAKGAISGRITGAANGEAINGADACAYLVGEQYPTMCATAGEEGIYTIEHLEQGEYVVELTGGSHGSEYFSQYYNGASKAEEATKVTVSPGGTTTGINGALLGGVISGHVQAAANHIGAAGVEVCATGTLYYRYCTVTDSQGDYRLGGLLSGGYIVEFNTSEADRHGENLLTAFYNGVLQEGLATEVTVSETETTRNIDATLAEGGRIEGTVRDDVTHEPLSEVTVCLRTNASQPLDDCTETGPLGEYRLTGLKTGEYFLEYRRQGWLTEYWHDATEESEATAVSLVAGKAETAIDENLDPLGTISGEVTAAAGGQALAGIEVCVDERDGGRYYEGCAETNEHGDYAIHGLPAGEYSVEFYDPHDEYLSEYYEDVRRINAAKFVSVSPETTAGHVDAALTKQGAISGQVSGQEASGLQGVSVCATGSLEGEATGACTTTGPSGRYSISGLDAGSYVVHFDPRTIDTAGHANYLGQYYRGATEEAAAATVSVSAGASTESIDATLARGGEITGVVTGAPEGTPLDYVDVCALDSKGNSVVCEYTGPRGEYALAGLPSGSYRLDFTPGYYSSYVEQFYNGVPNLQEATPIELAAGTTRTINAELTNFGRITGKVTTDSTAVAGVSVCAMQRAEPEPQHCTTTNEQGEYTLYDLPDGDYWVRFDPGVLDEQGKANLAGQFYGGSEEEANAQFVGVTAGSTEEGIDAELQSGATVSGTVVGAPSEKGLEGIQVCPVVSIGTVRPPCTVTDHEGRYELTGISTGSYVIRFEPANEGPQQGRVVGQFFDGAEDYEHATPLLIQAGEQQTGIDAKLVELGTISGNVTSASEPGGVPGVEVCATLQAEAGPPTCTTTGTGGRYTLSSLANGGYSVSFDPTGLDENGANYLAANYEQSGRATTVTVGAGNADEGIDATLPAGAVITGRVTALESGETQQQIRVCALQQEHTERCTESGLTGKYQLTGLPTGAYEVRFGTAAGQQNGWFTQYYNRRAEPAEADQVAVTAGHTTETIDAALARGRISGQVTDADTSAALQGVQVCVAAWEGGFFSPCTSTDSHGSYAIEGLPAGSYVVRFAGDGYPIQYFHERDSLTAADTVVVSAVTAADQIDAQLTNVPMVEAAPTISGEAREGQTLEVTHGEWSNKPRGFAEQWERCDPHGTCEPIEGADTNSYKTGPQDVGETLRVTETASNAAGPGEPSSSVPTGPIEPAAPVNEAAPSISGRPQDGVPVKASPGTWSNAPTSYEYQWLRCEADGQSCASVEGATETSYTPVKADVGEHLEVRVTATGAGGKGTPASSPPSEPVLPAPPSQLAPPGVLGNATVGATLTEVQGRWSEEPHSYEIEWLACDELGESCVPIPHETGQQLLLTRALIGSRVEAGERAINSGGTSQTAYSEPTTVVTGNPPTSTAPPTITGAAAPHQPLVARHGSWTGESLSYEDQWLRCAADGSSCTPIKGATGITYVATDEDLGHTLIFREIASDEGGPSKPAFSTPTALVQRPALIASAGEPLTTIAGAGARLDASGSSPASEIESYEWQFGDGANASGANVTHAYASPGSYTATVTVRRGSETASQHVVVTVDATTAADVHIHVQDSGGHPVSGASVLYIGSEGARSEGISDTGGSASLAGLPSGPQTVYAWAEGYQPTTGKVEVGPSGGEATVTLQSGPIVSSEMKSHELNRSEIEAAGIDTSEPGNNRVFEFVIRLAFIGSPEPPHEFHCDVNAAGEYVGSCVVGESPRCTAHECVAELGGGGGSGGAGGSGEIVGVPVIVHEQPVIQWLVLRGKVTVVKQFFGVAMITQNLSGEPFKLAHGQATLSLPSGLSLAPTATPQSLSVPVAEVPGGGSATTEWIVRGDAAGSYHLSAAYTGTLEPFGAPVRTEAVLANPLTVWGAEALSLSVKADNAALSPGVPYHVQVAVTNKAQVPLYNVDLALDENTHANFIFQPQQHFDEKIAELKPGQTLTSGEYILVPDAPSASKLNPSLSSATFVGQKVHPGEGIEAVPPSPIYAISAPTDTPYMVHLHWQAVPGAEGYEVFPTPNLETPFGSLPEEALAQPGASEPQAILPADATDAYLPGDPSAPPRYYAVSALIGGRPTLSAPVIPAVAGSPPPAGGVAGTSGSSSPSSENGSGGPVPTCADHEKTLPGGITIEASCFTAKGGGVFGAKGSLRVNGIDLTTSGEFVLNVDDLDLSASNVEVHAGSALLYRGPLDWHLRAALTLSLPHGVAIKGMPLEGQLTIKLGSGIAKVEADAAISSGHFKVSGTLDLELELATGLKLRGLVVQLGSNIPIKGVVVKTAKLAYKATPSGDQWEGAIELELPGKLPTVRGALVVIGGQISLVEVVVTKLNKYIAYGVFLQKLGLKLGFKPVSVTGTIGLSAGPDIDNITALSLEGSLGASFGTPVVIEATGNEKLVDQTLADGWVRAKIPGGVTFGAREVRKFAGVGVEGRVSGTISSTELEAQGSANVSAGPVSAAGEALVNTAGIAGCATATVGVVVHKTVSIGGAYRWNGQTSVFHDSCGFGRLKTALGARAAADGPVSIMVPAATHQINLVVHGASGPPTVILTDADGQKATIDPESDGTIGQAAYVAVADAADGDTDIALSGLPTGTAQVAPAPGTPAIGPVGSVLPLPKPKVRAHLTRIAPHRYKLRWNSAPIPGQRLTFEEVDRFGTRPILATARDRGTITFTTATDGAPGTRSVRVAVTQDELLRETATLAHFTPPALRIAAPRVRIAMHGRKATIEWTRVNGAQDYEISVHTGNGRWLYFRTPSSIRSLKLSGAGHLTARVDALGPAFESGPAGTARLSR